MPTLNWIGKDKVINHHMDVPFKVLEHSYGFDNGTQTDQETNSGNKIIHGDNLEALKALLPEYEGKVKCIYIDPPYNTGNESWVYNDNVNDPKIKKWLGQVVGKEAEDLTRHDKWLCMMYPRLKLLHKLLADDGAIFISIDDNEQANLKLICDEIFGSGNFVTECIIQSNSAKNNANYISVTHEYMFIYSKKISSLHKNWKVKKANVDEFVKRTKKLLSNNLEESEIKKELRHLVTYPRFFDFDHYLYVDKNGPYRASDLTAPNSKKFFDILHPITNKPCKIGTRGWGMGEEQIKLLIETDKILFGKDESVMPQLKNHLKDNVFQTPKSVLFFDTQNTTKWIKSNNFDFSFPKPIELLEYVLEICNDPNSIILDSFAGSGTTAHAVLNLNKQDGGNRKFICIEMEDYAETITSERVKRVIKGYGTTEGINGNFDFYELGQPMFLEDGSLNELVGIEKMRQYIYYTETKTNLTPTLSKGEGAENNKHFLGRHNDTAYYFNYEQDEVTTLDHAFLATMKTKAEQYVIYADNCLLTKDFMTKHHIIFKKIPRDITRF
jgi:adenine-specific DNA-methyltransferase